MPNGFRRALIVTAVVQVCIGSAERCAELLARYADAGCERVHLWPLGDEPRQIELAARSADEFSARQRS